jgi:cytoskeletal protein RodZ
MKDLFKDIKTRLLAHESDMDLDSAWASLEARRSNKAQKKSRFRLASVLLLLLLIGGCGTWVWVKNLDKHVVQTTQQQRSAAGRRLSPAGQPAAIAPNNIATSEYHGDNVEIASNGSAEGIITEQHTGKASIENNPTYLQTPPVVQVTSDQVASTSTEAASTLTQTTGTTRNLPPSLLMLAQRDLGLLSPKPSHLNLPARFNTQTRQKSAKKKANHATAVYIGGGYLTTQQQFSDSENQSAQGGAALRKQTEQPLPSFTFHAGVQRGIGKGRLLDFGVHYDQWYDRLDYTYNKPHTYQYNDVLVGVRRLAATGSEVATYGDIIMDGTQKVHALYYNRYASINLRLAIVQSIYHNSRWDIALGVGANASIWARADGLVSAPDPVQGTYELDKIYNKTFGLGISALPRLTYRFNEHYALQLTPTATWGLNNTLNTTSPLQSRLRQYSATAGLVYKF